MAAGIGLLRGALAVPVAYLTVLTAAAWVATVRPRRRPGSPGGRSFALLVPAHDEEDVIGETLAALLALEYPASLRSVHVIADHCTDATVDIALACGVEVHRRDGVIRGKGPGLASVIDELTSDASGAPPDAFVIVDADTIVAPGFLDAVDQAMAGGSAAVQGQYRVRDPGASTGAGLRAAALTLRHHLRPLGRTTLGASSGLYGNGMAFRRELLQGRAWTNHLTEDIEMQMELLLEGTLVAYAPDAVVEAEMPATLGGAVTQNERWERGRLDLARRYIPVLARATVDRRGRQRVAAADALLDHLVPPLSVLVAAVGGVTVAQLAVTAVRRDRFARSAVVLPVAIVVHVASGLVLGRAPASVYRSLIHAPAMVVWKVRLWARMLGGGDDDVAWVRTARTGTAP
ncbi:MAG: glycosyltransferase family 2 protein [Ilumatobacteraceae bacterium]